jgi:ubiquinone biosynthesis protein COQ9
MMYEARTTERALFAETAIQTSPDALYANQLVKTNQTKLGYEQFYEQLLIANDF